MRLGFSLYFFLNVILLVQGFLQHVEIKEQLRIKSRADVHTRSNLDTRSLVRRARINGYFDTRKFGPRPENGGSQAMDVTDQQIVEGALDQARLIAAAILRIPRGDRLYAHIMGDPQGELYDHVMQMVRRVFNLLGGAGAELPGGERPEDRVIRPITFIRAHNPQPERQNDRRVAATRNGVIMLFDRYFESSDLMQQTYSHGFGETQALSVLREELRTRGAVLFHELIHLVSDGSPRINEIYNLATAAGAVFPVGNNVVYDVPLNDFQVNDQLSDEYIDDLIISSRFEEGTVAYGADAVIALARLTHGRFAAALNADSYTALGVAVLNNLDVNALRVGNLPLVPNIPQTQNNVYDILGPNNLLDTPTARLPGNRAVRTRLNVLNRLYGWLATTHKGV